MEQKHGKEICQMGEMEKEKDLNLRVMKTFCKDVLRASELSSGQPSLSKRNHTGREGGSRGDQGKES